MRPALRPLLSFSVVAFMAATGAFQVQAQVIKPIVIGEAKTPTGASTSARSADAPRRPEGALDCAIEPSRIVEIASPLDGVLADVFVRPGDVVKAGDVIARIDTDIAAAELANAGVRASAIGALQMAKARASAAGAEFATQKRAFEGRVAPRVDMERARGELQVAREEVRREEEALKIAASDQERMALIVSKGEIKAPFDGIIGEDVLDPSEAIEGRPIAQLIVIDPMRVEVFATAKAVRAIRKGAEFVLTSQPDDPLIADVALDYISPLADSSSQTIRVFYHLSHDQIAPGFRCFMSTRGAAEDFRDAVLAHAPAEEATQ